MIVLRLADEFSSKARKKIPRDWTRNRDCGLNCALTYLVFNRSVLGSEEHVFSESGLAEVHSLREKAVRDDIAKRLGNICSKFSADEFEALVSVMAARQVKCERRA